MKIKIIFLILIVTMVTIIFCDGQKSKNAVELEKSEVENWNPGMMSDEEKEKYGIEEIPLDQVKKKAAELNIPSDILEEFYQSGDKVLYYATNLVEFVEPIDKNSITPGTKEALIEETNTQIDRSNRIIRAFSSVEKKYHNEENLRIIRKHEAILLLLDDLLTRVQLADENDSIVINSLWKEFNNIKETIFSQSTE